MENIFTKIFSFFLFGINLIFIPIKSSNVQAVTRKINGKKKEKIDQGSDAGSSLKERLHSRKTGIKIKKIKQNTRSRLQRRKQYCRYMKKNTECKGIYIVTCIVRRPGMYGNRNDFLSLWHQKPVGTAMQRQSIQLPSGN